MLSYKLQSYVRLIKWLGLISHKFSYLDTWVVPQDNSSVSCVMSSMIHCKRTISHKIFHAEFDAHPLHLKTILRLLWDLSQLMVGTICHFASPMSHWSWTVSPASQIIATSSCSHMAERYCGRLCHHQPRSAPPCNKHKTHIIIIIIILKGHMSKRHIYSRMWPFSVYL